MRRRTLVTCLLVLMPAAGVYMAPAASAVAGDLYSPDFDGDGFADLAIGVPEEDVAGVKGAGAVSVLYGGDEGLSAAGNQLFYEDIAGIPDADGRNDMFGFAAIPGDFDGDGYADLAVGAPFEDVGPLANAGQVVVIYGSASGLTSLRSQLWTQNSPGVPGRAEIRDQFGYSLAAGDFDGDGRADLAIDVQREDLGVRNCGAVEVLYGSAGGLSADRGKLLAQGMGGVPDVPEESDEFGSALAAGDFDGDGRHDLAIGTLREDVGAVADAGAVTILRGSDIGLTGTGAQLWTQDSSDIRDVSEPGDWFGRDLVAGDLNGDSLADLAIGAPTEDVGSAANAGAVSVLYGSAAGLSSDGNQLWTQDSKDVPDTAGRGDQFGKTLAVGDLDGDLLDDLAVGARYDDPGGVKDAGVVNLLYGTSMGVRATGAQLWTQEMPDVPDPIESPDHFGSCLAVSDFGNGGPGDLVVGTHFESLGDKTYAGSLHVLYGTADGLAATGSQFWTQDSPGVLEDADPYDYFPAALGAPGSGRCG